MITETIVMQKLFSEDERKALKGALSRDKLILPAIIKIVQYRAEGSLKPSTLADTKEFGWATSRAYLDGRASELLWLLETLTKE